MTTCPSEHVRETWPRGNVEYLDGLAKADVELGAQPVKVTFDRATFLPCTWAGAGAWNDDSTIYTRPWRTTTLVTDADLPDADTVDVFLQVTDTTEILMIPAGTLTFI